MLVLGAIFGFDTESTPFVVPGSDDIHRRLRALAKFSHPDGLALATEDDKQKAYNWWRRNAHVPIFNGSGLFYSCWNVFMGFLVFVTAGILPFGLTYANELPAATYHSFFGFFAFLAIVFAVHFFINCRTSFELEGRDVTDPKLILKHYLRKWHLVGRALLLFW